MGGILDRIRKTPENEMADDDHPNRPDLTKEEADQACKEIYEKYKNRKIKKGKKSINK